MTVRTPPQPPSPVLPTLRFRLPGDWWAVTLLDRVAAVTAAKRLIRHRVGVDDDRSVLRARLLRDFTRAIDDAIGGGGQQLLIAVQIVEAIPLPITIAVYLPDVALTPAIGTSVDSVLRVLEQGLDSLDTTDLGDLGDVVRVEAAQSQALRSTRVRRLEVGTPSDPGEVDILMCDYWLAIPRTKRVLLINVSTSFADLRDVMVDFFDAIVRATYWQTPSSDAPTASRRNA